MGLNVYRKSTPEIPVLSVVKTGGTKKFLQSKLKVLN